MNDIYSFYQLISKYQIEIPIIQRDYAQGRDNAKAADVRKSLVEKMINAVIDNNPLFFDFVYGRVDDFKFIPFDGQQRLTTLFLFHKYVFEKCQSKSECPHKGNCVCKDILGRFSYATRQSSREFCEKLVQKNVIPDDERIISENIKNQSWFYPDWQKDPTVMGMLSMLDEIQNQLKKVENFKSFAERLTSGCNCPITFHFVDMGEHKLSDETYVKMNARGKQLTPFENFKASLEQYLESKEESLFKRFKGESKDNKNTGIDGIWLDLFWNKEDLPDTLLMSFFNRHFMNVWRCKYAESKSNSLSDDQKSELDSFNDRIQKEMPLYPTKDNFVSFEIYRNVMEKCGIEKCLTTIFNFFDELCDKQEVINTNCQAVWNRVENNQHAWNLYQGDKNNNNRETYPSRVVFYALMKYFEGTYICLSQGLEKWMRVVWNIIENSTIDSSETYHAALRLIEKLSGGSNDIYKAIAEDFNSFGLGNQYHAKEQVQEEIEKAKKIIEHPSWESKIIDAEKYAFFKGAIRFLFTDEKGEVNWDNFDTKWENAKKYFDKEGIKEEYSNNHILLKTLIASFTEKEHFKEIYYDESKANWRNSILLNNHLCGPVGELLIKDSIIDFDDSYRSVISNDSKLQNVQMQLVKSKLIENLPKDQYYMEDDLKLHVYYGHRETTDIYLGDTVHENHILAKLIDEGNISCDQNQRNTHFFFGRNINFKYKNNYFQWYGFPRDKNPNNENRKELDVYLMENDWKEYFSREKKIIDNHTENETYYCFIVTKEMEENANLFTKQLDCLIAQAYPDADKSVCEKCMEKDCEQILEQ